ncbi:hypothetical protein KOI35_22570 [Actinoplanes bogorensis]|uniref:DUF2802 domain-containing protein n=1 Tax=Paractinoplanes bogorensis TaxID=1610840 RepID=A0ABS5YT96_9ACTN|nr:hypothetical protein [Actinoplanes bogorensis]MBU2666291.1 hypothetical protein [Actinoplanes bogorensis]
MSTGGTDASLLQLVVGFFIVAAVISLLTVVLRRRRNARQDLMGTQLREMEARAAATRTRLNDVVTQIAETRPATPAFVPPPPVVASEPQFPDATAPSGGEHDAMADAYAWLRIAAMVEAGQREQAVELLSTTMSISPDEAELLVDGLTDAGGERRV